MASRRTSEEIARIRPAFNSNGKPGILESIVRTGRERKQNVTVDVEKLRSIYGELGCASVVRLIEFLASDKGGIQELGSGSIDLAGATQEPFSIEGAMSLQELYIGNPRTNLSPLQWLMYLAEGIQAVVPEQRKVFDEICRDFLAMHAAVRSGTAKEVEWQELEE